RTSSTVTTTSGPIMMLSPTRRLRTSNWRSFPGGPERRSYRARPLAGLLRRGVPRERLLERVAGVHERHLGGPAGVHVDDDRSEQVRGRGAQVGADREEDEQHRVGGVEQLEPLGGR